MKGLYFLFLTLIVSSCNTSTRFRMISARSSGIDFGNRIVETDSLNAANYEYIYNGGGVGIADLNNDGLPDIVLQVTRYLQGFILTLEISNSGISQRIFRDFQMISGTVVWQLLISTATDGPMFILHQLQTGILKNAKTGYG